LSFASGETVQTFNVSFLPATGPRPSRTLKLLLSSPGPGAQLAAPVSANLTLVEADPVIGFGAAAYQAPETAGFAKVLITRSVNTVIPVEVIFKTVSASAVPGTNYESVANQAVVFPAGVVAQTVLVPLIHNPVAEGPLLVTLRLHDPVGAGLALDAAVLTIRDVDHLVSVRLSSFKYSTTDADSEAQVTVLRAGNLQSPASVDFETVDDSAKAGIDYLATSGTLSFAPGETAQSFPVAILADEGSKATRSLRVRLLRPAIGVKISSPREAHIVLAETDPVVQFSQASYTSREIAGTARMLIRRTVAVGTPVEVTFSTVAGTAIPGIHYQDVSQVIRFEGKPAELWKYRFSTFPPTRARGRWR